MKRNMSRAIIKKSCILTNILICILIYLFAVIAFSCESSFAENANDYNAEKYAGQTAVYAYVSGESPSDVQPDEDEDQINDEDGSNSKTGDDSTAGLWFSIAVCALAGIWVAILRRK